MCNNDKRGMYERYMISLRYQNRFQYFNNRVRETLTKHMPSKTKRILEILCIFGSTDIVHC